MTRPAPPPFNPNRSLITYMEDYGRPCGAPWYWRWARLLRNLSR